jgi:hypothetical protein
MHPSFLGATQVYNSFILPRMNEYGHHIDNLEKNASQFVKQGDTFIKSKVQGDKKE